MSYILTFDIGTTSVKTCLFDKGLSVVANSTEEYSLITGPDNMVELDAQTYFDAVVGGLKNVATKEQRQGITAICITTQGETMIPVDSSGNALRNAIVWLDARASQEAEYISTLPVAKKVYERTGVPVIDSMVPVAKLLWIKNNEPEIYRTTYKFLLLEDYIIYRLTGIFVTEKVLLCSTAYFDIRKNELFTEMFEAAELDSSKIPDIRESGDMIGCVTSDMAVSLGINPNAVVVMGAMDQVAAAIGGGNIKEGVVTETTGTCMMIMATTDESCFSRSSRVIIYSHVLPGKYYYAPFCITAGMVLKWFKDEFCAEQRQQAEQTGQDIYDILSGLAAQSQVGSNGLIIVPYMNGVLQPENLPNVRGVFFGASLDTKKPQFVRAIFEGIGYMLRENIELIESVGVTVNEIRSFGGGSRSRLWQKIKADISGKRISTMMKTECASLGVAVLASVALGWYPDLYSACAKNEIAVSDEPDTNVYAEYDKLYKDYKRVFDSTKNLF